MSNVFRRNIQVDTIADALTVIQSALADAGWSTISGSPSSLPLIMGSQTIVNGVRVFIRFTNPSGQTLRMQGDIDGAGTNLSAARDWTLSNGTRLWMACDNEATCIYLKPTTGNGFAYHNGRLDRLVNSDGYAWQTGLLTTASGNQWDIAQGWNSSAFWLNTTSAVTSERSQMSNLFAGADNDPNTITGKPQLGPYFRAGSNTQLHFRGIVKFAVSGLAGAAAGSEWAGEDGKIYVASGVGAFRVQ